MSGYNVKTPNYFASVSPATQLVDQVTLLQNTIRVPERSLTVNTAANVTYDIQDLLGGFIIRSGITSDTEDYMPTATQIIEGFKLKCLGVANFDKPLPNGSSFVCKLFNASPDYELYYYTNNNVYIGGSTDQITENACCLLEFIIQDQASLGEGHIDRVFVCMSRCAAAIAPDLLL